MNDRRRRDVYFSQDVRLDNEKLDIFQKIAREIRDKYEENLEKAFASCGFTKDYIVAHPGEFMVESMSHGDTKTYYHNDDKLFTIYTERQYEPIDEANGYFFTRCFLNYAVEFYGDERKQ